MTTPALASRRYRFSDWDEAQEYYHSQGMTDGLPIVPPTQGKVTAMLDHVGLEPSTVVAREDVREKSFTAEKIAINAVMAGCKPEYMPVIVSAVKAMTEPEFNLQACTASTNGADLLAVISAPIAKELRINSGTMLMGHGPRANASIGRALALIKINVYGSTPHHMDKSTFGNPGKFTFCFAEDDDVIPWEPLRVEKGYAVDSSTVTMFAAIGPLQVSTHSYTRPEEFLSAGADAAIALGPRHNEMMVVISPEVLEYVRRSGWTKSQIKEFIFEKAQRTGREWNQFMRLDNPVTGDALDAKIPAIRSADHITVVGGGGAAGAFISVIGSWGGSASITREIGK